MNRFVRTAGKVLLYAFFALGVILLVTGMGKESTMIFSFTSFVFCWALQWLIEKNELNNRDFFILIINIGFWLGLLGDIFLYFQFEYYDKVIHIFIGVLLASILYQYYTQYTQNLKLKKEMVFFSALGMLAFWEIYEYILYAFFGYPAMGVILNGVNIMSALDDTMFDLICGSLGAIIYLIFKKEKINERIKKAETKGREIYTNLKRKQTK